MGCPRRAKTFLVLESKTFAAKTRPNSLSPIVLPMLSVSLRKIVIPFLVPQSSSLITTSCATSTRRRVRYPASAVLSAVSLIPFREPCVEIKYSKMLNPSLKLSRTGNSIISLVFRQQTLAILPVSALDFFIRFLQQFIFDRRHPQIIHPPG